MSEDVDKHHRALDSIFHASAGPYPVRTSEYENSTAFVRRVLGAKAQRGAAATSKQPSGEVEVCETGPEEKAAALRFPATYNPRYKVNVSIVPDAAALERGLKEARHIARQDRAAGDPAETANAAVADYKQALTLYEDFQQKRHFAQLGKLLRDRAQLPIAQFKDQIVAAVRNNPVVVLAGDTGCGKSTQVPQYLLEGGFARVACTQPRRLSAVALARRCALEMLAAPEDVGYQVRFDSTAGARTRLVFLTEGILLRLLASDPLLDRYDVVIVDEVHERHLTTDFLLALLRAVAIQRPALRLLLMSATINHEKFSYYFGGCPVIQVPGRLYPIEVKYKPSPSAAPEDPSASTSATKPYRRSKQQAAREQERIDPTPYLRLLQEIDQTIPRDEAGDLLVFLAGVDDITAVSEAIAPYAAKTARWIVLPLHASLSVPEQDKAFDLAPQGVRKCILATNVAEASITVDKIRFVADSGRAKHMVHDVLSGLGALRVGGISKASADQRKGRSGRTGPGICYRMYSAQDYDNMPPFSVPEVLSARLESVVLQIKLLAGSGVHPADFGFVDNPPRESLEAAIMQLKQAGALSPSGGLEPMGAALAMLPVDVGHGKMLVLACLLHMLNPVLTVAAAMSVQSPFLRVDLGSDSAAGVQQRRVPLVSPHGDAVTLLNVYEAWLEMRNSNRGAGSTWCRKRGLEESRLVDMAKLRRQFTDMLSDGTLRAIAGLGGDGAASSDPDDGGAPGAEGRGSAPRQGGRRKRSRMEGLEKRDAAEQLRRLQKARDAERGRRVLSLDAGGSGDSEGGGSEDEDGGAPRRRARKGRRGADDAEQLEEMRALDLLVHADLGRQAAAATAELTADDMALLRLIIAWGLYPNVAVADLMNKHRRDSDAKFITPRVTDVVVHPGSVLSGAESSVTERHILLYASLLQTSRTFAVNLTPVPALPTLLLCAQQVDTDDSGDRALVDGWLLIRFTSAAGPVVLAEVAVLRSAMQSLLASRMRQVRLPAFAQQQAPGARDSGGLDLPPWARTISNDIAAVSASAATTDARAQAGTSSESTDVDGRAGKLDENGLAERLVNLMEWPIPFSLSPVRDAAVTSQYVIVDDHLSDRGEGAAATSGALPAAENDDAREGRGSHAISVDDRGVPTVRAGVQLGDWLRVGSLRSYASAATKHRLSARWSLRWACARCGEQLLASYSDVVRHAAQCDLSDAELDSGYDAGSRDAASSTAATQAPAAAHGNAAAEAAATVERGVPDGSSAEPVAAQVGEAGGANGGQDDRRCGLFRPPAPRRCSWGRRVSLSAPGPVAETLSWWCDSCGRQVQMTRLQWLQHLQTHADRS